MIIISTIPKKTGMESLFCVTIILFYCNNSLALQVNPNQCIIVKWKENYILFSNYFATVCKISKALTFRNVMLEIFVHSALQNSLRSVRLHG